MAEAIGGRTIGELEELLTIEDLYEWAAFFRWKYEQEKLAMKQAELEAKARR